MKFTEEMLKEKLETHQVKVLARDNWGHNCRWRPSETSWGNGPCEQSKVTRFEMIERLLRAYKMRDDLAECITNMEALINGHPLD